MMSVRRTYYANTVEAAVAQARKELGEDTLLVESRPTPAEERPMGAYAVVFQTTAGAVSHGPPAYPLVEEGEHDAPAQTGDATLSALQADLARLSGLVSALATSVAGARFTPELGPFVAQLAASDMPPDLTQKILERVERRLGLRNRAEPAPPALLRRALAAEVQSHMAVNATLGLPDSPRRLVAFVGPPGAGKTTTLVKLAMRMGVTARRPTAIVSTDTYRIAAAEQLRAYAAILGLPFELADTSSALTRVLLEHSQKELVLIDSPGFGPNEHDCFEVWASMLNDHPEIETQLVLSATTRGKDLQAAVRRWSALRPAKLIFTHLDETACFGGCLAASHASGLPISFLCAGQAVPEDVEPASTGRLLQLLLGDWAAARAAAAATGKGTA